VAAEGGARGHQIEEEGAATVLACCSTPKVLFCTFLVLHFIVF
jgi:hypothetical protein